ncbi:MAG: hypothetical protein ABIA59_05030 [Candidatus Latescibacterota bacterium]
MNGKKRTVSFLIVCATATFLLSMPAHAHFERLLTSSRTLSLGGAFVSVADDPSACLTNPAGLAQTTSYSLLVSLNRPYGLSDLEESYFAAAIPAGIGVIGLSWHRFALDGITSEDLISLAFGGDYIRNTLDASLSFGGSIDIARVSYQDRYNSSKAIATGSLGMLLRPFPIIGIGYSVRNLGQGSFDFIPGGGRTPIRAAHTWGVSYHWQQVSLLFERQIGQDRIWKNHMGLEIRIPSGLRIRTGLDDSNVTGGIGLQISRVHVDVAVAAHDMVGTSYMVTVGYSAPGKKAGDDAHR